MTDPLSNVDWCLLRSQRNWLLTKSIAHLNSPKDVQHSTGIVNLLDDLIDHALDTGKLIDLYSHDDLKDGGIYKYVRVAGEFRFFSGNDMHKQAVGSTEIDLGWLESAGTIAVFDNFIRLISRGSMSLKISGAEKDEVLLADLFGKQVRVHYEG